MNKTSVILTRSHDDTTDEKECSYCQGIRIVDDPETGATGIEEKDCMYQKLGFTTTKFRVDDLEKCLINGFTRCGTYVYNRNNRTSCCETWQYKVNILDFKMSQS